MEKPIKLDKVIQVYSGKSGECYCGCSGTYWYSNAANNDPEFVSLTKVKRIVNKLNKNISVVEYIKSSDEDIYTLTIGTHDWTVYCKKFNNLDYLAEKYEESLKRNPLTKNSKQVY